MTGKQSIRAIFCAFAWMPYTTMTRKSGALLGMTIRENGRSHIHFHPAAGDNLHPFGHFNKKYRQVSLTVSDLYPHHVVKAGF